MKNLFRLTAVLISLALLLSCFPAVYAADNVKTLNGTELRGVFVDSLNNKDFPSAPGLSEAQLNGEIGKILDFVAANGLNAVFIKVCASGDALYSSKVYPVSYYLTGKQGGTLSFDPLKAFITSAHKKGIKVFAWIDPVRATLGAASSESLKELEKYVDPTQGYTPPQLAAAKGDKLPQNSISVESPATKHPEYLLTANDGAKYFDIANPAVRTMVADAAAEIASGYEVDGIHLDTDIYPDGLNDDKSFKQYGNGRPIEEFRRDNITDLLKEVSQRVASANASAFFGVSASGTAYSPDDSFDTQKWIADGFIDYIVPRLYHAIGAEQNDFKALIEGWEKATYGTDVLLMPALNVAAVGSKTTDGGSYLNPSELLYEIMLARSSYSDGHVYSDSTSLLKNPLDIFSGIYRLYLDGTVNDKTGSFDISSKFAVTRPSDDITVTSDTYFILGTSDPNKPLYVNGEEITNRAPSGTFGVLIDTPAGSNEVTVIQGSKNISRVIKHPAPSGEVSKITKITQSSMLPSTSDVVKSGTEFTLKCIAPSGATVTATVAGNTATLKQAAATAENGVPATYKGTVTVSGDFDENKTTNVGPVEYTLNYNGKTTSYKSTGELYYIGANTTASVEVPEDVTLVYKSDDTAEGSITNLRRGTNDYIVDVTDTMFKLGMGGYVPKGNVKIVEGAALPVHTAGGITFKKDDAGESFLIKGAAKVPFRLADGDGTVRVYLYNLKGVDGFDVSQSGLFASASVEKEDTSIGATFTLKSGVKVGGYNVEYRGDDAIVTFKYAPKRSANSEKPLEGVTVVLDPGHGGNDPGAIGPTGTDGAMEEQITLAVSQKARSYLQELGATVYMTRQSDNGATLTDRTGFGEKVKPDFFVSVHINSAAESSNSNKSKGVEVYYYTDHSAKLASNMLSYISSSAAREARNTYRSTYVVTRNYYAPSVLCELGFITNPAEYEQMVSAGIIDKTGYAIAQGILSSI